MANGDLVPRGESLRLALIAFISILFFVDGHLNIATERYLFLARAIAEQSTFEITGTMTKPQGDMAHIEDRYYCGSEPGLGIVTAAVAWVVWKSGVEPARYRDWMIQVVSVILLNGLLAALTVNLWFRLFLIHGLSLPRARLLSLTGLLGTHFFFYAVRLSEYSLVIFLETVLLSLISGTAARRGSIKTDILSGIILGLLYITNILAFAIGFIFFTFARSWPPRLAPLIRVILFFAPIAALRLIYMDSCFDNFLASPYQFMNVKNDPRTGPGILAQNSLLWKIVIQSPLTLWGLLFDGVFGLLTHAPIFVLPLVAAYKFRSWWNSVALGSLMAVMVNASAILIAIDGTWKGSVDGWGPRYFLPCLPFLLFLTALSCKQFSNKILTIISGASIFINWIGVQYSFSDSFIRHIEMFIVGGPTTPIFRQLWLYWTSIPDVADRLSKVDPNMRGYYYALTHPSPFFGYVIFGIVLFIVIRFSPCLLRSRSSKNIAKSEKD